MGGIAAKEILQFLEALAKAYHAPATLHLIGGGALCLLGHERRTLDLDFSMSISEETRALRRTMENTAKAMDIELEMITLEEFVPIPDDASRRHRFIGRFGSVEVYVYDPYTIALSKLARGLETDIQDILFLLEKGLIEIAQLEFFVEKATPVAWKYDVDPADLRRYMNEVRRLYRQ
ncbi:hypothetical protein D6833_08525 [Candidatus Parcubacteria bacterium]|nr:MAG: hypothetical protein D6833_08525 [Candidatus Parcubacteria bacterium]